MYIKRAIEEQIKSASERCPVILLSGLSDTGLTAMLKRMAGEDRTYVSLSDPRERFYAVTNPEVFLQRHQPPVLIDEIQYAPELLPRIKVCTENNPEQMGAFWLADSYDSDLSEQVTAIFGRRAASFHLGGLSNAEIRGIPNIPFTPTLDWLLQREQDARPQDVHRLYERIFRGSMPAMWERGNTDRGEYYEKYIERFFRQLGTHINGDPARFYRFMVIAAARTANTVRYSNIALEAEISPITAKRWLSILEAYGIIAILKLFSSEGLGRGTAQMPLIHFLDSGLCAYLLKWNSAGDLERGDISGQIFKSYVYSEILKSYHNAGRNPEISYYRDKNKRQIDLMIQTDGKLYPVIVSQGTEPSHSMLHTLEYMRETRAVEAAAVVSLTPEIASIGENTWCIPAWML